MTEWRWKIMEDKNLKEFQNWIKQSQDDINYWTTWLFFKAKEEGKTYSGAMRWLRKNRPDTPRSFHATATETFTSTIQAMFDDATIKVRDEGLNRKCDNND